MVKEHEESREISPSLTTEEIQVIQRDFKGKLDVLLRLNGKHTIRAHEYVGYIVLPNRVINIRPKIPKISFVNMVKFALDIPEIGSEDLPASDEENFYDILVLFLIKQIKSLLQRGLYHRFVDEQDNTPFVRGKILFKEHITLNYGRNDRVFCQFSELTADIPENRIVKSTLYHLLHVDFLDERIHDELVILYKSFDEIELSKQAIEEFEFITYTPLNEHYRPTLNLCQLILQDSSLSFDKAGQRTSMSFLIDMNELFQDFVGNLLVKELGAHIVKLQGTRYPEEDGRRLHVKPDIVISDRGKNALVIDTKYKELGNNPDESEVAQMVLYAISTGIRRCMLIYAGNNPLQKFKLKDDIELYASSLDLAELDKEQFQVFCHDFVQKIESVRTR